MIDQMKNKMFNTPIGAVNSYGPGSVVYLGTRLLGSFGPGV